VPRVGLWRRGSHLSVRSLSREKDLSHAAGRRDPGGAPGEGPQTREGPDRGLADVDFPERAHPVAATAGRPVYGPAGREEARRLSREARRDKINLGWYSQINLCRVSRGERPLSYSVWKGTCDYVARKRVERELAERPLQFQIRPGRLQILWRKPGS